MLKIQGTAIRKGLRTVCKTKARHLFLINVCIIIKVKKGYAILANTERALRSSVLTSSAEKMTPNNVSYTF